MTKTSDYERMASVLSSQEMARITEGQAASHTENYMIDLHGLKRKEAKRFLNNIVNLTTKTTELHVIHGYNHGTVLKDMIREELSNPKIREVRPSFFNLGETILKVA